MGWQDDELAKRNIEKSDNLSTLRTQTDALQNFWDELLNSNETLLPEIRASIRKDNKYDEVLWGKQGGLIFRKRSQGEYYKITIDDGRGEYAHMVTYDMHMGLGITIPYIDKGYKSQVAFYKLQKGDIDLMLQNLCTGKSFSDGFLEKLSKPGIFLKPDEKIIRAGEKSLEQNAQIQNRSDYLNTCLNEAAQIINSYIEKHRSVAGINFNGGLSGDRYTAQFQAAGINGNIDISIMYYNPVGGRSYKDGVLSAVCVAHSCRSISKFKGAIPEPTVHEMIQYATRKPTLQDRFKKLTGSYYGEL